MLFVRGDFFIPTQTDAQGRTLLFPFGRFAKGRVVADPALLRRLSVMQGFMLTLVVPATVGARHQLGWTEGEIATALAAAVTVYGVTFHVMTRRLPTSEERFNALDGAIQHARAYGSGVWWYCIVVGLLGLALDVIIIAKHGFAAMDALVLAFLGICTATAIWNLRACSRGPRT